MTAIHHGFFRHRDENALQTMHQLLVTATIEIGTSHTHFEECVACKDGIGNVSIAEEKK